jgi:8-oxo-dGTP pyrophosphatase MutT (NUDIX family)
VWVVPTTSAQWIELLRTHSPIDEREEQSINLFLSHIVQLPDPFNEHANDVHVTASALVIDEHVGAERVVLHLHKRLNFWMQPGGHIDVGESAADGALREAREETGLDVRHPVGGPHFVHVDVHPGPRGHTHLDLRFVVLAPGVQPAPPEGESQEVRWFGFDEALVLADVGLRGGLEAVRGMRLR